MAATPSLHQYRYDHLTISGLPGSGSTTLLRLLKQKLEFDGWRGFSGGEFMRAYAQEKGLFKPEAGEHHSAAHYEDEFDRQIDYGMREKLQHDKRWILESWLSGFLAQQVPGVLKVLIWCSDDSVRIDRIVNRDKITVDKAKAHIHQRYSDNFAKWSRMYQSEWQQWVVAAGTRAESAPIDFWHPALYDVVIDTYSSNQEQTLVTVLNAISPTPYLTSNSDSSHSL